MFNRILVPTDGSPAARRALARALDLARGRNAQVTVFWVAPPWEPNLYAYDGNVPAGFVSPRQHVSHVKKAAERHLAPARKAARSAGVRGRFIHREGAFPDLEIIRMAKRDRCDLIVMGSHGPRGFLRVIIGSVTAKVLAQASVPVMVCR
jgi:nucleotide-binding universal stress UspA family protein